MLRLLAPLLMVTATPTHSCESELAELFRQCPPHELRKDLAYPVGYDVTVAQNEACRLEGRAALALTHASRFWDKSETTADSIRATVAFARRHDLITIGLVSRIDRGEAQFYAPGDLRHIVGSDGGAHRLELANVETVIFAGGQLSLCLGETIREALRSPSVSRIVLVSDAIFDFDRAVARPFRVSDASEPEFTRRLEKLLGGGRLVFGKQLTPPYRLLSARHFTFRIVGGPGRPNVMIGNGPRAIDVYVRPADRLEELSAWFAE